MDNNGGDSNDAVVTFNQSKAEIMRVYIDKELCTGCSVCVKICAFDAISLQDGKAVVDKNLCRYCGACVQECRFGAISMLPDEQPVNANPPVNTSAHSLFNMPFQNRISNRPPALGNGNGRGMGSGRRGGNRRGKGSGRKMGRGFR